MTKRSKNYLEGSKKVDRLKLYDPKEAIEIIKEVSTVKFDETVDLAVKLGVNPKHADQQIRGAVVLPNGTGKDVRVVVFAKGEKVSEAEAAGADFVGAEDLVSKIEGGWFDFDIAIATPDMMKFVGKLGRVLGPKGMMPNPKSGTVTFEVGKAVQEFKAGKVEYRVEKAGIIHLPIGKVSFESEKLFENFRTVMDLLVKAKPSASKGQYLRSITLSSTMGPGVKIAPQKITG